jgi:hypothetical protein
MRRIRLRKNLQVFKFLQAGIETIRSRLAMKIYDEYANILRGMYSGRVNGFQSRCGFDSRPVEPPRDHSPHH